MVTYKPVGRLLMAALCSLAVTSAAAGVQPARDTFKRSTELGKRTANTSAAVDKYVAQLDKTEQALSSVKSSPGEGLQEAVSVFLQGSK